MSDSGMSRVLIVLGILACLSVFGQAQTAEELVSKNIQAHGGMDKIKAIKSIRVTGKLSAGGGFTAATTQENQRPNLVRETFSLQGMTAINAYDGEAGWQIQPFGGRKDPQLMGEDSLRDLLLDSDFDGPLVDYKEKGNTVEFLGHDVVDGDDALRLKVTLKNGDILYYFLDPDTFLRDSPRGAGVHPRLGQRKRARNGIVQAGRGGDVSLLDCAGDESESRRANHHHRKD